jgi:hypothetical protein
MKLKTRNIVVLTEDQASLVAGGAANNTQGADCANTTAPCNPDTDVPDCGGFNSDQFCSTDADCPTASDCETQADCQTQDSCRS